HTQTNTLTHTHRQTHSLTHTHKHTHSHTHTQSHSTNKQQRTHTHTPARAHRDKHTHTHTHTHPTTHTPGQVCSDGDGCQVEGPEASADLLEGGAVACVTREERARVRTQQCRAT